MQKTRLRTKILSGVLSAFLATTMAVTPVLSEMPMMNGISISASAADTQPTSSTEATADFGLSAVNAENHEKSTNGQESADEQAEKTSGKNELDFTQKYSKLVFAQDNLGDRKSVGGNYYYIGYKITVPDNYTKKDGTKVENVKAANVMAALRCDFEGSSAEFSEAKVLASADFNDWNTTNPTTGTLGTATCWLALNQNSLTTRKNLNLTWRFYWGISNKSNLSTANYTDVTIKISPNKLILLQSEEDREDVATGSGDKQDGDFANHHKTCNTTKSGMRKTSNSALAWTKSGDEYAAHNDNYLKVEKSGGTGSGTEYETIYGGETADIVYYQSCDTCGKKIATAFCAANEEDEMKPVKKIIIDDSENNDATIAAANAYVFDKALPKAPANTPTGKKFGGWTTEKNGITALKASDSAISSGFGDSTKLYAIWEEDEGITYDGNAKVIVKKESLTAGTEYILLSGTTKKAVEDAAEALKESSSYDISDNSADITAIDAGFHQVYTWDRQNNKAASVGEIVEIKKATPKIDVSGTILYHATSQTGAGAKITGITDPKTSEAVDLTSMYDITYTVQDAPNTDKVKVTARAKSIGLTEAQTKTLANYGDFKADADTTKAFTAAKKVTYAVKSGVTEITAPTTNTALVAENGKITTSPFTFTATDGYKAVYTYVDGSDTKEFKFADTTGTQVKGDWTITADWVFAPEMKVADYGATSPTIASGETTAKLLKEEPEVNKPSTGTQILGYEAVAYTKNSTSGKLEAPDAPKYDSTENFKTESWDAVVGTEGKYDVYAVIKESSTGTKTAVVKVATKVEVAAAQVTKYDVTFELDQTDDVLKTYTLTGSPVSVEKDGTVATDKKPVIKNGTNTVTPAKTGYAFKWMYTDGSTEKEFVFGTTPITKALTVTGKFVGKTYTITFKANDKADPATADVTAQYQMGDADNATTEIGTRNFTRNGFTLVGWSKTAKEDTADNGTTAEDYATSAKLNTILDDNKSATDEAFNLFAVWKADAQDVYTVTFNNNDGTGTKTTAKTNENKKVTKPTDPPKRAGYKFVGWFTDPTTGTEAINFTNQTFATHTDVYAHWAEVDYSLVVSGVTGATTTNVITATDSTTNPSTPAPVYTISGNTKLGAPTKTGFTFAGWQCGTKTYAADKTIGDVIKDAAKDTGTTGSASVTIEAQWEAITVTYKAGTGVKSIGNASDTVSTTDGKIASAPTVTYDTGYDKGYEIKWVYTVNGTETEFKFGTTAPSASIEVTANCVAKSYKITFAAGTGASGAPDALTAAKVTDNNATTNALAIGSMAKPGYTFNKWKDAGSNEYAATDTVADVIKNNDSKTEITLTATWTANTYTIKLDPNNYGTIANATAPSALTATVSLDSAAATIPADPTSVSGAWKAITGYHFDGWYTKATPASTDTAVTSYTLTADNISDFGSDKTYTLYAKWAPNTYTIKYDQTTGDNTETDNKMADKTGVAYGAEVTLDACKFKAPTGKHFAGWSKTSASGNVDLADGAKVTNLATANGATVTLYAIWENDSCTVTLDANGKKLTSSGAADLSTVILTPSSTISVALPTWAATGYTLTGFSTTPTGTPLANDAALQAIATENNGKTDVKLYAIWEANKCTVKFNGNTGSGTTASLTDVTYGTTKALPACGFAAPTGMKFKEWNTTANGKGNSFQPGDDASVLATSNGSTVTLYAIWQATDVYDVTFDYQYEDNGAPKRTVYTTGSNSQLTGTQVAEIKALAPTRDGYTFNGWFEAKTGGTAVNLDTAITTDALTAGKTYYAHWTKTEYTVKLDVNGGSLGTSASEYPSAGKKYYIDSDSFSLPTPTKAGSTFVGWFTEANYGAGTTDVKSVVKGSKGNLELKAKWTTWSSTVTFNRNAGSDTVKDSQNAAVSTDETKTVTYGSRDNIPTGWTREGYTFKGWAKNATDTTVLTEEQLAALPTKETDTTTLYAIWTANTYTVTFNANGGTGTMTAQSFTYNESEKALTKNNGLITKAGYSFAGWAETKAKADAGTVDHADGKLVQNLAKSGTLTLYAVWTAYQITFTVDTGETFAANGSGYTTGTAINTKDGVLELEANNNGKLPVVTNTDTTKKFLGWVKSGEDDIFDFTKPITGNVTLVAKWGVEAKADNSADVGSAGAEEVKISNVQSAKTPSGGTLTVSSIEHEIVAEVDNATLSAGSDIVLPNANAAAETNATKIEENRTALDRQFGAAIKEATNGLLGAGKKMKLVEETGVNPIKATFDISLEVKPKGDPTAASLGTIEELKSAIWVDVELAKAIEIGENQELGVLHGDGHTDKDDVICGDNIRYAYGIKSGKKVISKFQMKIKKCSPFILVALEEDKSGTTTGGGSDIVQYLAKWVVEGKEVASEYYFPGATPVYRGKTPTKASDSKYSYAFTGWDKAMTSINADTTYTAVFKKIPLADAVGEPTDVKLDAATGKITWKAAENAEKYQIAKTIDGKTYYSAYTTELTYTLANQTNKAYSVKVIAVGKNGDKAESESVSVKAKALGAVTDPTVNKTSGKVTWKAVTNASSYKIIKIVNGKTYYSKKMTDLTYTVKLPKSSACTIVLRAYDIDGAYKDSKPVTVNGGSLGVAYNVKVDGATVTWTKPANAVSYKLVKTINGKNYYSSKITATSYKFNNGTNKAFTVRVVSFDKDGNKTWSAETYVAAKPMVINPKADITGKVTWEAAPGAVSYKVGKTLANGKTYYTKKLTDTTFQFDNVPTNPYQVFVVAFFADGSKTYGPKAKITSVPKVTSVKLSSDKKTLSWKKTTGIEKYQVAKMVNGKLYYGSKVTTTSYKFSSAPEKGTVLYVIGFDKDGKTSYSDVVVA